MDVVVVCGQDGEPSRVAGLAMPTAVVDGIAASWASADEVGIALLERVVDLVAVLALEVCAVGWRCAGGRLVLDVDLNDDLKLSSLDDGLAVGVLGTLGLADVVRQLGEREGWLVAATKA